MRKDLEALPHLALAAHFPPVSQGHEVPAWCPQTSRTPFPVLPPESQDVSRQEQLPGGRKRDLLSVFAGSLEVVSVKGIRVLPTAGRSGSYLIVGCRTAVPRC